MLYFVLIKHVSNRKCHLEQELKAKKLPYMMCQMKLQLGLNIMHLEVWAMEPEGDYEIVVNQLEMKKPKT